MKADLMTFEIAPVGLNAYFVLVGIALFAACAPLFWLNKDGIAVSMQKSLIALVFTAPIILGIAYTMHDNAFELQGKNVLVRADYFYRYERRLDELDLSRAQIGSYQSIPAAQLHLRRNGLGLPGMQAGHFSTQDGKAIFAAMTDQTHVLYLPAKSGASLLVSVQNPNAVLDVLKRAQSAV